MTPEQIFAKFAVLVFVCGAGASFAFGFAIISRWLKWAPINVTVSINNPPGTTTSAELGRDGDG